jgi:hypothetical protein
MNLQKYCFIIQVVAIHLIALVFTNEYDKHSQEKNQARSITKSGGKCKGLWRPDKLVGKCFGLKSYIEYDELKNVKEVKKADECRAMCCNLGEQCITWSSARSQ